MDKNFPVRAIASGILAAAMGLGYLAYRDARAIEAASMAVAKKRAALNMKIRELEERIAARGQDCAKLAAAAGTRGSSSGPHTETGFATDPKAIALGMASYRASLRSDFAVLYRTLGLSPAQVAAFENLMVDHEEAVCGLRAVAAADRMDLSDETIATLAQQEDDKLRTAQISLLGDTGFQQFQQFERVEPLENMVEFDLALTAGVSSPSLTDPQRWQLAAVLAKASNSGRSNGMVDPSIVDWSAAITQAQGILSEPQLEGLKSVGYRYELDRLGRQFLQADSSAK